MEPDSKRELKWTFSLLLLLVSTTAGENATRAPEYQPEGCLRCGQPCLQAAENTLLPCITAAVGEAMISVFSCVKESLQTATACKKCLASLACCVTDSCSFCECSCANLLRFSAPISSPTRVEQPWLFQPECHFAYMGTPACKDCDGKRVYKSIDCQQSMYLHYHDYLLDGRWVLTPGLDDDDRTALVRNLGDGFDDEECPERESWGWEMRSTRAPGTGWREDGEILLKHFIEGDSRQEARSSELREGPVHFV